MSQNPKHDPSTSYRFPNVQPKVSSQIYQTPAQWQTQGKISLIMRFKKKVNYQALYKALSMTQPPPSTAPNLIFQNNTATNVNKSPTSPNLIPPNTFYNIMPQNVPSNLTQNLTQALNMQTLNPTSINTMPTSLNPTTISTPITPTNVGINPNVRRGSITVIQKEWTQEENEIFEFGLSEEGTLEERLARIAQRLHPSKTIQDVRQKYLILCQNLQRIHGESFKNQVSEPILEQPPPQPTQKPNLESILGPASIHHNQTINQPTQFQQVFKQLIPIITQIKTTPPYNIELRELQQKLKIKPTVNSPPHPPHPPQQPQIQSQMQQPQIQQSQLQQSQIQQPQMQQPQLQQSQIQSQLQQTQLQQSQMQPNTQTIQQHFSTFASPLEIPHDRLQLKRKSEDYGIIEPSAKKTKFIEEDHTKELMQLIGDDLHDLDSFDIGLNLTPLDTTMNNSLLEDVIKNDEDDDFDNLLNL